MDTEVDNNNKELWSLTISSAAFAVPTAGESGGNSSVILRLNQISFTNVTVYLRIGGAYQTFHDRTQANTDALRLLSGSPNDRLYLSQSSKANQSERKSRFRQLYDYQCLLCFRTAPRPLLDTSEAGSLLCGSALVLGAAVATMTVDKLGRKVRKTHVVIETEFFD